jgi:TolA-binding protein
MTGRKERGRPTPRAAVAVSVAGLLITLATIMLAGTPTGASASQNPHASHHLPASQDLRASRNLRRLQNPQRTQTLRQPGGGTGNADEFARRQYETGLAFMRDGRYQEALKDFQAVADNYPSSAVADQALLQIAMYHFEQARDAAKASATLEQLLKAYPTGRAAPFAYLLSGRIALAGPSASTSTSAGQGAGAPVSASARGASSAVAGAGTAAGAETRAAVGAAAGAPSKERVDAALASFERARRLFPVPEVTAAAGYYTGEALRASGRCADAMKAYQDVIVDYPRLVWSSRAELGVGRCLVALDRARDAMPHLQRVRRSASGVPPGEAETALRWNTILARLLLRAPTEPAFTFASRAPAGAGGAMAAGTATSTATSTSTATLTQVRNVVALAIAPKGDIAVLGENALVVYGAQGGVIESFNVNQPRGLTLDAEGRPVVVTERGMLRARAQLVTLRAGEAATGRPLEELAAVGVLSNGDIIAADRRTRAIHRFDAEGQPRGAFAAVSVSRLAVNERDEIAAVEREGKSIVLLDPAGTIVRRIPPRGEGYTLAEPADVAIDAIGHVYVLDRDQAAVFVFTKDGRLLATLRSPESGESAFRQPSSIALDPAGRVYIHDERQRTVVIYQ